MSMTGKDYQALSARIRNVIQGPYKGGFIAGVAAVADELAEYCRQQNPAFDVNKFYADCGLNAPRTAG